MLTDRPTASPQKGIVLREAPTDRSYSNAHAVLLSEFRTEFLNGAQRSVNRKVQGSNPWSGANFVERDSIGHPASAAYIRCTSFRPAGAPNPSSANVLSFAAIHARAFEVNESSAGGPGLFVNQRAGQRARLWLRSVLP